MGVTAQKAAGAGTRSVDRSRTKFVMSLIRKNVLWTGGGGYRGRGGRLDGDGDGDGDGGGKWRVGGGR